MAELVSDPENREKLAVAIGDRPELLFRAAEYAVGRPRQTLEMVGDDPQMCWTPPARAEKSLPVPPGALVFLQSCHIHEGGEEEHPFP